jgi:regulator of replication initiation timing
LSETEIYEKIGESKNNIGRVAAKYNELCKVVKVTLTKNTTLQRMEQLSPIECNYIRN